MQHQKTRVAVVVSHPIQHFCPQYCSWAKLPGIELKVFFASRHGLDSYHDINFGRSIKWNLLLDFDHAFLPGADGRAVQAGIDSADIEGSLDEFSPDVVICYGYSQALQRRVIRWAEDRNRSLLMIADSELRQHRNPLKALAKKFALPGVFSKVDVFLTVGDANEAYYRRYGAIDTKFVRAFFPIDVKLFDEAIPSREATRAKVCERHGIPPSHMVVLTVGKLIGKKRQIDLAHAASRLRSEGVGVTVLLAGTGDQEQAIRNYVQEAGVSDVVFLGFVEPEKLVDYYLAADVYVHCSSVEPHSLAISEAIYSGLPIVLSDRCGSYGPSDDVRPGLNGFVYPCGDVKELSRCLARLARSEDLRRRMGAESQAIGRANQALAHGKALRQALELTQGMGPE